MMTMTMMFLFFSSSSSLFCYWFYSSFDRCLNHSFVECMMLLLSCCCCCCSSAFAKMQSQYMSRFSVALCVCVCLCLCSFVFFWEFCNCFTTTIRRWRRGCNIRCSRGWCCGCCFYLCCQHICARSNREMTIFSLSFSLPCLSPRSRSRSPSSSSSSSSCWIQCRLAAKTSDICIFIN